MTGRRPRFCGRSWSRLRVAVGAAGGRGRRVVRLHPDLRFSAQGPVLTLVPRASSPAMFVRSFFRASQVIGLLTALSPPSWGRCRRSVSFDFDSAAATQSRRSFCRRSWCRLLLGAAVYSTGAARLADLVDDVAGRSHRHRDALRHPLRDGRPGRDGSPAGRGGDEPGASRRRRSSRSPCRCSGRAW